LPPSPFPLSHAFLRRPRPMRKWIQGVWGRSGNPVAHRHVCPFMAPPAAFVPLGPVHYPSGPPIDALRDRCWRGVVYIADPPPPGGWSPPSPPPPPPAAVPVRAVGVHLRASMEPNTDTPFPRVRRFGWGEEIRSLWGFLTEDGFHNPTPFPQNRSAPPQY